MERRWKRRVREYAERVGEVFRKFRRGRSGPYRLLRDVSKQIWNMVGDEELALALFSTTTRFANTFYDSAVTRFGLGPEEAGRETAEVIRSALNLMERVGPLSEEHRRWLLTTLNSVRIPRSPPVAAWYFQHLLGSLTDQRLADKPLLRDAILKSVRRNNLSAFHKLVLLVQNSSEKDLQTLERHAEEVLRKHGRKRFPKDRVGELVDELVHYHAIHRLASAVAPPEAEEGEGWHLRYVKELWDSKGGDHRLEKLKRIPLIVLAAALALEGKEVKGRRIDPRYLYLARAVASNSVSRFAYSLMKDAPPWVKMINHHVVTFTDDRPVKIIVSRYSLDTHAEALERFPTCHTPLYGEYADFLLFTPEKNGISPVVVSALDERGRVIGRVTALFDSNFGNVFITSVPFGKLSVKHYVEALTTAAKDVNERLGRKIFKRVVVGDFGGSRFVLNLPDFHDTFVERAKGKAYVRGRIVRKF